MQDNKVIMGRFASPHGVVGEIKVVSFTEPKTNLLDYHDWFVQHQGHWCPITIQKGKAHGQFLVVKIKGIDDRDQVHLYTNDLIALERERLPDLADNTHYWTDLVGLTVVNMADVQLGIVDSLIATGANDVLVVKQGATERLIPYTSQTVKSVKLNEKRIVVDWEAEWD